VVDATKVTILAISILAVGGDPVTTAPGTDLILKLKTLPGGGQK